MKLLVGKGLRVTGVAVVVGLFVIALAVAGIYTFSTPRHFISLGTPIRQDDFTYIVTAVGRTPQIANRSAIAKANGIFYIVTIHVDNDAKREDFKWDERIPHIVDAQGERYDKSADGQAALDAALKPQYTISAGQSASFQAVFDVPADIQKPLLAFDNGILMGDLLNLVAYRRIGVILYQ
ncbi:MAG: DUF4352 domain-containing protein [Candidatus Eremiobacteraeota bacterium]|nr:DUF4352 domain-containing protein [Candidatus Eremiobacteraeota bacterium]